MARLETPSAAWQASFLIAMDEIEQEGPYAHYDLAEARRDFAAFIRHVIANSRGEGLPKGYVPNTDYWLIDDDEFIGRVSIRHELTEGLRKVGGHIGYEIRPSRRRMGFGTQILALALPKARELGITRALVTCDDTNIASKKIIESNGGVLQDVLEIEPGLPRVCRYWIELSDAKKPSLPGS